MHRARVSTVVCALLGAACTKLIGLPDLPDVATDGGSSGIGGKAPGGAGGTATGGATKGAGGARASGGNASGPDSAGQAGSGDATAGSGGGARDAGGAESTGGAESAGGTEASGGAEPAGGVVGSSGGGGMPASGGTEATGGTAGQCDPPCAGEQICEAGQCVCPGVFTAFCSNTCIVVRTDPNNCGDCGRTCEGDCSEGRCVSTLVESEIDGELHIAVNATHLYFSTPDYYAVSRVARGGGAVAELTRSDSHTGALVLDDEYVYWMVAGTGDGAVMRMPLSGGTPTALASALTPSVWWLAGDASNLYWFEADGSLMGLPKTGGTPMLLASDTDVNGTGNLLTDGSHVFFPSSNSGGSIVTVPLTGDEPWTAATELPGVSRLALLGGALYFDQRPDGQPWEVAKVSTGGGPVSKIFEVGVDRDSANRIAVDSTGIYVARSDGPILKFGHDGESLGPLAREYVQVRQMIVDRGQLFWTIRDTAARIRVTDSAP